MPYKPDLINYADPLQGLVKYYSNRESGDLERVKEDHIRSQIKRDRDVAINQDMQRDLFTAKVDMVNNEVTTPSAKSAVHSALDTKALFLGLPGMDRVGATTPAGAMGTWSAHAFYRDNPEATQKTGYAFESFAAPDHALTESAGMAGIRGAVSKDQLIRWGLFTSTNGTESEWATARLEDEINGNTAAFDSLLTLQAGSGDLFRVIDQEGKYKILKGRALKQYNRTEAIAVEGGLSFETARKRAEYGDRNLNDMLEQSNKRQSEYDVLSQSVKDAIGVPPLAPGTDKGGNPLMSPDKATLTSAGQFIDANPDLNFNTMGKAEQRVMLDQVANLKESRSFMPSGKWDSNSLADAALLDYSLSQTGANRDSVAASLRVAYDRSPQDFTLGTLAAHAETMVGIKSVEIQSAYGHALEFVHTPPAAKVAAQMQVSGTELESLFADPVKQEGFNKFFSSNANATLFSGVMTNPVVSPELRASIAEDLMPWGAMANPDPSMQKLSRTYVGLLNEQISLQARDGQIDASEEVEIIAQMTDEFEALRTQEMEVARVTTATTMAKDISSASIPLQTRLIELREANERFKQIGEKSDNSNDILAATTPSGGDVMKPDNVLRNSGTTANTDVTSVEITGPYQGEVARVSQHLATRALTGGYGEDVKAAFHDLITSKDPGNAKARGRFKSFMLGKTDGSESAVALVEGLMNAVNTTSTGIQDLSDARDLLIKTAETNFGGPTSAINISVGDDRQSITRKAGSSDMYLVSPDGVETPITATDKGSVMQYLRANERENLANPLFKTISDSLPDDAVPAPIPTSKLNELQGISPVLSEERARVIYSSGAITKQEVDYAKDNLLDTSTGQDQLFEVWLLTNAGAAEDFVKANIYRVNHGEPVEDLYANPTFKENMQSIERVYGGLLKSDKATTDGGEDYVHLSVALSRTDTRTAARLLRVTGVSKEIKGPIALTRGDKGPSYFHAGGGGAAEGMLRKDEFRELDFLRPSMSIIDNVAKTVWGDAQTVADAQEK